MIASSRGKFQLCINGYPFTRRYCSPSCGRTYWKCVKFKTFGCKAKAQTDDKNQLVKVVNDIHNHTIYATQNRRLTKEQTK